MTISFDISTSCVGYSVFNEDGTVMQLDYVKFDSKQTIFEKFNWFKDQTKHLLNFKIKYIAIEEPLEKFKGKFSSAHTIAILNFFNGMISSYLYSSFGIEPVYYNVNNVRSTVFEGFKIKKDGSSPKYQVWQRVVEMEPQINWKYGLRSRKLLEENFDACDAYAVGRCHLKVIKIQEQKLKSH